jgi:dipeptidyl aminopeptidase/acylaminoacyl peptidase
MKDYFALPLAALAIASAGSALARPMTETDLATMKRLAAPTASADGSIIVYQLQETDLAANKRRADLWMIRTDMAPGGTPQRIASKPGFNETSPAFAPDGRHVYYLSNESGSNQLWRFDIQTAATTQLSNFKTDIAGFKIAPDGKKVAVWGDIGRDCGEFGCDSDGDRSKPGPGSGREYDELFVRHWDAWETPGNYSRIFTFGIGDDGKLYGGHPLDEHALTPGNENKPKIVGDAPTKPLGGGEEVAWGADSEQVYYALRVADRNEPLSTNLDIYRSDQNYDAAENLTPDNKATDTLPAPSPDGKWLAYAAMARPGYEADRQVVMLRDLKTGKTRALTEGWDRSVGSIAWAADSKSLLVTAQDLLEHPLFRIDLKGKVTRLTQRGNVGEVFPLSNGGIVYTINSIAGPNDLVLMDAKGKTQRLTNVNADHLKSLDPVQYSQFTFKGASGATVYGQVVKPMNAAGKLPTLLVVHGGPQGSFYNSWSFRWNPAVMASQGYAVVTIDFHGSTGYGQAFTDAINKDWGGKPLEDLKLGMAEVAKIDPQLDPANACALGASYGGYMMNWIAGQWPDGFKCLVNHAGIFDLRSFAMTTEELWFDEWDQGGPWWKRADPEKWNPVNHITKWKTPTLVTQGLLDYRVPYSQSLGAFTVLQRQGIESKLVVFPDENHWILKPQNSIQWHRTVFDWLAKHLKK